MKLLIAGDLVPVGRFEKCLKDNSYDYGIIKSITDRADYSILNFEAPIVGNEIKGIKKDGYRCYFMWLALCYKSYLKALFGS